MADEQQLAILGQGVEAWNKWRHENHSQRIDLTGADLSGEVLLGANLDEANLSAANLSKAILNRATLARADLTEANLTEARLGSANLTDARLNRAKLAGTHLGLAKLTRASLSETHLYGAILSAANLCNANLQGVLLSSVNLLGANLAGADLRDASLRCTDLDDVILTGAKLSCADLSQARLIRTRLDKADLREADLRRAVLTETNLDEADLSGAKVYGVSVWNAKLKGAIQKDIVITDESEPVITVDNLEVAQFIHLLLNNEKIRDVIDTIAKKVVLILGSFSDERKYVLDRVRERLRNRNYSPVLFDFERPVKRDFTETIVTLAHLSRFIIADITEPKCAPQETQAKVPILAVPVVRILKRGARSWGMYTDVDKYGWALPVHKYEEVEELLDHLEKKLIPDALDKEKEIEDRRRLADEERRKDCGG